MLIIIRALAHSHRVKLVNVFVPYFEFSFLSFFLSFSTQTDESIRGQILIIRFASLFKYIESLINLVCSTNSKTYEYSVDIAKLSDTPSISVHSINQCLLWSIVQN